MSCRTEALAPGRDRQDGSSRISTVTGCRRERQSGGGAGSVSVRAQRPRRDLERWVAVPEKEEALSERAGVGARPPRPLALDAAFGELIED
jgi:hypothetical protein